MFFADYARSVTILIRGASLDASMSRYLIDELARKPNVHVRTGGEITRCTGDERLERVTIRNRADGSLEDVDADAVFIFIGADANTDWLPEQLVRDERGYVCTGRDVTDLMPDAWPLERDPYLLETSVPGIFAAGDVRHGSIKRVASGVGEGSIAIAFVHEHLADLAGEIPWFSHRTRAAWRCPARRRCTAWPPHSGRRCAAATRRLARDAGAGRAERMAERDRAAVEVDACGVDAERIDDGERLAREGLVELHQIDVLDRQPSPREHLARGLDRPDPHDLGLAARDREGADRGQRLEAVARRVAGAS